jgi:hypothetical protein
MSCAGWIPGSTIISDLSTTDDTRVGSKMEPNKLTTFVRMSHNGLFEDFGRGFIRISSTLFRESAITIYCSFEREVPFLGEIIKDISTHLFGAPVQLTDKIGIYLPLLTVFCSVLD